MSPKVTIRDVAREAGVSPSAVTIALNNKPGVSAQTRAHIAATAQRMGYTAGKSAKPLERNMNIHYVIPRYLLDVDPANVPVYHELLMQSIEKYCRANRCFMVVHYLRNSPDEVSHVIQAITQAEPSPMVIVQAADLTNETVSLWKTAISRVVFLNKNFIKQQVDSVSIDNEGAVYAAVNYLIDKGYEHIGYLEGRTYYKNLADRQEGYQRCLDDHNMKSAGTWVVHTSYEQAYLDVKAHLAQGVTFSRALMCSGDRQAMGVIRALVESGIRVPQDVAVMGFDDLPSSAAHNPPLSTCRTSWDEMAKLAVQRVLTKTGAANEHNIKYKVGAIICTRTSA